MSFAFIRLSFSFILIITVRDVKSDLDPAAVIESGLNVLTSLSNPLDLAKSVLDFATLVSSDNDKDDISGTLDVINDKLDEISENLDSFRKEVMSKLNDIEILVKIEPLISEFFLHASTIDNHYDKLVHMIKGNYTARYINDFIHGVANYESTGITQTLDTMHSILYKVDDTAYKYSLTVSSPVCPSRYLQVKTVQKFYLTLHNAELKGLAVLAYALKQIDKNQSSQDEKIDLEDAKKDFYERSKDAFTAQKETMSKISRVLWNCTSHSPEEGVTYEQFGPFIYKSFEIRNTMSRSFSSNFCPEIKDTTSECSSKYADNMQRKECKQFAYCRGKIKSCESLDKNIVVCETSIEKDRKYVYGETRGKIEGKKENSCSGRTYEHQASEYRAGYMGALNRIDSSCLCTCVNPDSNVYINLREAVSDVHKNKVITGIRFRKINDTFHLQVQQAKLLPSAAIDPKTKAWLKVNKTDSDARVGVDYHQLSWDYRSFELDDIEVTKNHVLTGVKFTLDQGLIRLEVRGSQFNYKSGKLRTNKHTWNRHDTPENQLKKFELEYLDLPPDHPIDKPVLTDPQTYTTLRTSSMDHDLGQSVIPFVDSKPIESKNPDIPLSGVGLFHKSYGKDAAGYLTLKIFTYNFT